MDFDNKTNLELRKMCEANGLDGSKGGRNDLIHRLKVAGVKEIKEVSKKKVETASKKSKKETR